MPFWIFCKMKDIQKSHRLQDDWKRDENCSFRSKHYGHFVWFEHLKFSFISEKLNHRRNWIKFIFTRSPQDVIFEVFGYQATILAWKTTHSYFIPDFHGLSIKNDAQRKKSQKMLNRWPKSVLIPTFLKLNSTYCWFLRA
jgi:hypothetical protein